MAVFIQSPICLLQTSDGSGAATFNLKIPGTFGVDNKNVPTATPFDGFSSSLSQGRYFLKAEIWCDTPQAGDRIYNFLVQDTDGVIPVPMQPLFPLYPIINIFTENVTETDNIKKGLWIPTNSPLIIHSFGNVPNFIPGGLYLSCNFQGGANKTIRCNFYWGIRQT